MSDIYATIIYSSITYYNTNTYEQISLEFEFVEHISSLKLI